MKCDRRDVVSGSSIELFGFHEVLGLVNDSVLGLVAGVLDVLFRRCFRRPGLVLLGAGFVERGLDLFDDPVYDAFGAGVRLLAFLVQGFQRLRSSLLDTAHETL